MAVRIISRNVVNLNKFIYYGTKCQRLLLHLSSRLDKNVQFCLSDIGEGIRQVTVKSWHVKVDDKVSQFDNICEVESDKATVTITSRYDGVIKRLYYNVEDVAFVGKPLVDIDVVDNNDQETVSENESIVQVKNNATSTKNDDNENSEPIQEAYTTYDKSLATPAVRRIAMQHNIKLSDVIATGKNNRVLKEDILGYLDKSSSQLTTSEEIQVKPITRIMKTMIKTMTISNSIPNFGYSDNVDFSQLVNIKSNLSKSYNINITYLPFIIKALSKSLEQYPILNSSLDCDLKNIIYKGYHNIGIAVDSPSGLIVPNIKNVQKLSIYEISIEIKRLQKAAQDCSLTPSELIDGTFSISNIGAVGGLQGMPCILPPEVAIVAVGKVEKVPRFDNNNHVVAAHIANFTFTADHRIIDGATVSRFCNTIKHYLENPERLLIEL